MPYTAHRLSSPSCPANSPPPSPDPRSATPWSSWVSVLAQSGPYSAACIQEPSAGGRSANARSRGPPATSRTSRLSSSTPKAHRCTSSSSTQSLSPVTSGFPHLPRPTGPEVRDILSGHGLDTDRKRARFLGVDRQTLGRWETERVPEEWELRRKSSIRQTAINFVRLADRLKRELPPGATLLNLIPPPEPEAPPMPRSTASDMTGQQFKDLLTGIGIETDYERARLCGVSRRQVARWRTGKCPIPQTVAHLVHLASLVDCPPDGSILDLIPLGPRPWS